MDLVLVLWVGLLELFENRFLQTGGQVFTSDEENCIEGKTKVKLLMVKM